MIRVTPGSSAEDTQVPDEQVPNLQQAELGHEAEFSADDEDDGRTISKSFTMLTLFSA